ncbi:MAG: alanine--tRNA ligase [Oscillospiraceae bacterium]|jgi:alanyl-tRNA synthetase|nr:alanine--tRNA ligase [Oscillospiraceae bacterium]
MKNYGLNELREMFLSFFEEKGHLRLQSFPLIPQNDTSLLLINSGMAPMKPWFKGDQDPPRKRICTCQKCIRTGDIENVGKTSRHGTYFEMLGNFSFGDYFKSEAIAWCWEFLTERLGLDPGLLYPSVYFEDDQAFGIWEKDIGVAAERITRLGKADNFWEHGSGPCGPCSEVYYDRGEQYGCGKPDCAPGCDCDRYVEIWNNVFTQFDNDGAGNYTELAQKNIDTGLGLERLAVVCQGVNNLFEVDTVMSIIKKISEISGAVYGRDPSADISVRVITDHTRSAVMMICDGVLPSNEARGYVLRRLLRRAARHGRLLGIAGAFLCDVCDSVIEENKGAYPDLIEKAGYISRIISVEEENFGKTIDAGSAILAGLIDDYKKKGETTLSGSDAFKLYDTYGFPLDLTIEILSENGLNVDGGSFDAHMQEQRERARAARAALGDLAWAGVDLGLDNTPTAFTGYEFKSGGGTVLAIVTQGEVCSSIRAGGEGIIVLDKTPFYAEMGGQSADFGTIAASDADAMFEVTGVQLSKGGKYLHHGLMRSGTLSVGDNVTAEIDTSRRRAIMRAHSATHLLQGALRDILGGHVQQAGSLVEPDKLRFDFTHFSALTKDELSDIERCVNDAILDGLDVTANEMPVDEAKKLGAMALFGEKYGDVVRVVKMGDKSIEFCGGTHLDNTAKAGAFSITAEFSVASGVRRIEAITGKATLEAFGSARAHLSVLSGMLKAGAPEELIGKLEQNIVSIRDMKAKLDAASAKDAGGKAAQLVGSAKNIGGLKVIASVVESADADGLRQMADTLRDLEPCIVAVLAAISDGKITIIAACGKSSVAKGFKAGDLVRETARLCGGSGGGKPDFAMGGGKDESKLQAALDAVYTYVSDRGSE